MALQIQDEQNILECMMIVQEKKALIENTGDTLNVLKLTEYYKYVFPFDEV